MPWASTARQKEIIAAYEEHGSESKAAKALGVARSTVATSLQEIRKRAARNGYSPDHDMTHAVPPGYHVKGTSTLYDSKGRVRQQWVKSGKDQEERWEQMQYAMEGLLEPLRGLGKKTKAPKQVSEDLLCVYPMGDPHLGMFAWMEETGQHFDLKIAEDNLCAAIDHLAMVSPPSDQALFISLGDLFHTDNSTNRTLASGNQLDVDTRYPKMARVGIRCMVYGIRRLLRKHRKVRVLCVPGNHDEHSSMWLAMVLLAYFKDDERVEIDDTASPYFWYRFGKNLVGATHGHTCKFEDLAQVMAVDRAEDWGETLHRYWYTGHIHHLKVLDQRGCTVRSFRTLAPADSYHHKKGYRSEQDMTCQVLHRDHGYVNEHRVGIRQLWTF